VNAKINKINETSETRDGTRQEVDEVDFITFVTDKGYFDIEFRNSSNGYYGGSMDLNKDASDDFVIVEDLMIEMH